MKNILSNKIIAIVAFTLALLLLGGVIFLAARPISYNMIYFGVQDDDYGRYEASHVYTRNKFEIAKNTNYDLPWTGFYYYKDGYIFALYAETDEHYELEVEQINTRWEEALQVPFYSSKINAYVKIATRPDGAVTHYYCKRAIALTVIGGVLTLAFAALGTTSVILNKKAKKAEQ